MKSNNNENSFVNIKQFILNHLSYEFNTKEQEMWIYFNNETKLILKNNRYYETADDVFNDLMIHIKDIYCNNSFKSYCLYIEHEYGQVYKNITELVQWHDEANLIQQYMDDILNELQLGNNKHNFLLWCIRNINNE